MKLKSAISLLGQRTPLQSVLLFLGGKGEDIPVVWGKRDWNIPCSRVIIKSTT